MSIGTGPQGAGGSLHWRGRVRLVDEVAQLLRERIYSGSYPPGTKLLQEALAEELEVSRTPLREALRVLERDGLLQTDKGRGVRVIDVDPAMLLEGFNLREAVDGVAARLAAERADEPGTARLREHLAVQRAAVEPWDAGAYTLANVEFHMMVMDLSGNRFVQAELPLVRMTSQVFTPALLVPEDRGRAAVSDHEAIVEAIAARDPVGAERLAREHVRKTIDRLSEVSGGA